MGISVKHFADAAKEDDNPSSEEEGPRQSYRRAQLALADMKQELAAAKAGIPAIVGYDLNVKNAAELEEAKQRFQQLLTVSVIDSATVSNFDIMSRMYKDFERAFPIEEEREEFRKLMMVLERNHDPEVLASLPPARQHWIVLETPDKKIVAARYISTFALPDVPGKLLEKFIRSDAEGATLGEAFSAGTAFRARQSPEDGLWGHQDFDGTQHLTYSFVNPEYRALGVGDYTMQIAEKVGREFIASHKPGRDPDSIDMLRCCEQNNPLDMTIEDFLADTIGSKTDPFWRRGYYQDHGFRALAFDYTQLPLKPRNMGGEPCTIMNLVARPVQGPASQRDYNRPLKAFDSDLIKFHIFNTATHSFAAGQYSVSEDPDWQRQEQALQSDIEVLPPVNFRHAQALAWQTVEYVTGHCDDNAAHPLYAQYTMHDVAGYLHGRALPQPDSGPARCVRTPAPALVEFAGMYAVPVAK